MAYNIRAAALDLLNKKEDEQPAAGVTPQNVQSQPVTNTGYSSLDIAAERLYREAVAQAAEEARRGPSSHSSSSRSSRPLTEAEKRNNGLSVGQAIGGGLVSGLWSGTTSAANMAAAEAARKVSSPDTDTLLGRSAYSKGREINSSYLNRLKDIWSDYTPGDGTLGQNIKDTLFSGMHSGFQQLMEGTLRNDAIYGGTNAAFSLLKRFALPAITGTTDKNKNAEWLTGQAYGAMDRLTDAVSSWEPTRYADSEKFQSALQKSSGAAQIAGQVSNVVANMLPSIALSVATKDPEAGLIMMSANAAGSAAKEAYDKGATPEEAYYIGLEKGYVEYMTEGMFDAVGAFGGGKMSNGLKNALKDVALTKFGRGATKLANLLGENAEEAVSDWAGTGVERAVMGTTLNNKQRLAAGLAEEDDDISFVQAMTGQMPWNEQGLITLLSTLVLGGTSSIVRNGIVTVPKEQAEEIIRIAKNSGNENLVALAEEYNRVLDRRGKLGSEQYGTLYAATEDRVGAEQMRNQLTLNAIEKATGIQGQQSGESSEDYLARGFKQLKYSDAEAQMLLDDFHAGDAAAQAYLIGAQEAIRYGEGGISLEEAKNRASFGGGISPVQFEHAWRLGAMRRSQNEASITADRNTAEGKETIQSNLEKLGKYAERAAEIYDSTQDVEQFGAAMTKAAELYAAHGADLQEIVTQAREGDRTDVVAYLTDEQVRVAQEIGQQIAADREQSAQLRAAEYQRMADAVVAASEDPRLQAMTNAIKEARSFLPKVQADFNAAVAEMKAMQDSGAWSEDEAAYKAVVERVAQLDGQTRQAKHAVGELEAAAEKIRGEKPERKRKKGTVRYGEVKFRNGNGKTESYAAADPRKFNKTQKAVAAFLGNLSKAVNVDYVLFDGPKGLGGAYIQGDAIYININAQTAEGKNIAAASAAHELTHWMQQFAPAEYEELKKIVLAEMMKNPGQFNEMVQGYVKRQPYLSYEDITDEMVANACMPMLQDPAQIEKIAREHMNLGEKIVDFLKRFVEKLRAAFAEVDFNDDFVLFREVKATLNAAEQMQEAWNKALDRAVKNYNATTNETETTSEVDAQQEDFGAGGDPQQKVQFSRFVEEDSTHELPNGKTVNTLKFLNDQMERGDVVHTYKTFLEIDGKLYPPMATAQRDENNKKKMTKPMEVGRWEESIGNADSKNVILDLDDNKQPKINKKTGNYKWKYKLEKDIDSTVPAAYNPYQHSGDLVLNDQFDIAYSRPNLVTYECIIPRSELTSGYHYRKARASDGLIVEAKDPVGVHDWKKGPLAEQLKKTTRHTYLSRWLMPVRKLDNSEVAQKYKEILDKEDGQIAVPFNVVPPGLQEELEKIGVPIDYNGSPSYQSRRERYGEEKYPVGKPLYSQTAQLQNWSEGPVYNRRALVSEETLEQWLKDYAASNPNYAQAYITYMSPSQFLEMTTGDWIERGRIRREAEGLSVDHSVSYSKAQPIQLRIDTATGKVLGHEGRHRMVALDRAGVEKVPVLLFDSKNKNSKQAIDSLTLKQQDDNERGLRGETIVHDVQPFSRGNVNAVREKFSKKDVYDRIRENYQGMKTVQFQQFDSDSIKNDLDTLSKIRDKNGTQLQVYAFEHDEPEYRRMLTQWGGMSEQQIDDLFHIVDSAVEIVKNNLEELDYAWEADIDDRGFSPVKPNSDPLYKVSQDFSTLCRKRILQQIIMNELQAAKQRALTREEGIAIRDALVALQAEGKQIEVACALCYVESARMRSPAQIQRFLDNREKVMLDFFAGKDRAETKARVEQAEAKERQAIYEESGLINGYDVRDRKTASLKKLPGKIADRIRSAKKAAKAEYKPTAKQQAEIDLAKRLQVQDFTTPEGLEDLAKNHREIFDAYTSFIRNATNSKGIENDTWWRAGDSQKISDLLIEQMNRENGLRTQSWSDFQVKHLIDYIAAVIELSTRGAAQHAYTKVYDYVDLMGNTGIMINMSLIPTREYHGKLEYDDVEGFVYDKALEMREKYPETAGTICIGVDDKQIRQLLESDVIDYVIPYHRSGMAAHVRAAMHIPNWSEYEAVQHAKALKGSEAQANAEKYGVKLLDTSDPSWHKEPNFSDWFDLKKAKQTAARLGTKGKYGVMTGGYMAMQEAAEKYKKICAERGLAPKFSYGKADFTTSPNYWKLLIDRKMVNNKTGGIIEQKPIRPNFDMSTIERILNDELERYGKVKKDQDEAIRRVTEAFLGEKIAGGMSAEDIAKAMQKPVDNITTTAITQAAKLQSFDEIEVPTSEAFKKWFRGSKVVNEDGSPMVVYHGTEADFTVFDRTKGRSTMDIQGMFFSPWEIEAGGYGSKVGAYYLSIKNPAPEGIAYKALNRFKGQNNAGVKAREYLESLGYDGVAGYDEFIAFRPEQIKSATDNVGTYDAGNPDVRYQQFDDTYTDTAAEGRGREEAYTRIQNENAILKTTIDELKKTVKGKDTTIEKILGKFVTTKRADADKLAKRIMKEYGSKADVEEVAKAIKAVGDYYLKTPVEKLDEAKVKELARDAASLIAQGAEARIHTDDGTLAEIKKSLQGQKVTIRKESLGDLDSAGGLKAVKDSLFGKRVYVSAEEGEGRISVDRLYEQLHGDFGDYYFPEAGSDRGPANEAEELLIIQQVLDAAEDMTVNPFEAYMGEAVEAIANGIAFRVMNENVLRPMLPAEAEQALDDLEAATEENEEIQRKLDKALTRGEVLKDEIARLKQQGKLSSGELAELRDQVYELTNALKKANDKYTKLQRQSEQRIAQVREEGAARVAEVRAKERERAAKQIQGLKDHYKDVQDRARERREESASFKKYRAQVQKKAAALYEMLATNSDKKHVIDPLKGPVMEFLESIDFSSKRKLRGGEETNADRELGLRMRALERALSGQQSYAEGTQTKEEAEKQQDLGGYVDISQENLQFLRDTIELIDLAMKENRDFTVNSMSGAQLKQLSNFLSNLNTAIRNLNSFLANARFESVREAASKDIESLKELGKADDKDANAARRLLIWENGTPYYVFRRFGEGGKSIFDGFTKGWEKLAFNAQEIINFTKDLYTDKEVNEWKNEMKEITLWGGEKIKMTTAQIMELSMLLNREQARKHIEKGGIRIGDIQTEKGTIHDTAHYHLTMDDVERITGMLTDRQRAVAKALQAYMAGKGAEWGNEISQRRFGYSFYTEGENYYPIRTDANDRPMADTDAQMNSMFRLLNLSSSKSLNPKASNALVVGNIFDTFADHMSDMAKLNGLGLPILDAIKWFNFKERLNNPDGTYDTRTMQAAMEEAYGSKALSYFRTLMKDINGLTESGDRGTNPTGKLLTNYKIAAVGANLRVALLQPTSFVRALTVLKPQFMIGVKPSVQAYREAMKYSGTAVWKSLGYYDTDIAKGLRGQIQHDDTWRDKIAEASMTLAEKGDQLTWSMLWTACKRQAAATTGKRGEELMQEAADLFREVIYSSQVMDSTLTRSEIMRGKTMWSKMNSAFMAEPTLSYNILLDAYSEYRNDVRRHGKAGAWGRNSGKIGKALAVYTASAAFASIVESLVDAARDDDDEDYWDKVLEALLGEDNLLQGNLAQDLTVIGKIPFLKNFINTLQGYSGGDMSATAFNNALNAVNIWAETARLNLGFLPEKWKLDKPTKTTYYGKMTPWGKVYKTLQAVSQMSGIAAANLTRDVTAIWNTIVNGTHDDWKIKTYDGGAVSGEKADAWKENLKPLGITKRQYANMISEMDTDSNGSLKQDEVGTWLNEQIKAGNIDKSQAEAIWVTSGPTWKKSFAEWNAKSSGSTQKSTPSSGSTASTSSSTKPAATVSSGITDYDGFKAVAPLYGAEKKEATYNAKPSGMSLDQYTKMLQAADADGNGSLKQDELGYQLKDAVQSGRMSWDDAVRVWAAQGWSHDLSWWAAKHP